MFLLICSYVLYMNWIPVYALILLGITLTTYTAARLFELYGSSTSKRKIIMWSGVLFTLTCLLFFKYYNFINDSLHELLANIGLRFKLPGLNWAIPIGISFYTFQAYGYMMDVYWSKIKAEKNFFDYALFVAFFPQIASGPISKASSLLPQIKRQRPFNSQQVVGGGKWLMWGMFMKVVLADRIALYANTILDNYTHQSGLSCFIASLCYTIQIYGDFAGYSIMAVGVSKIIGFELINNFNRPYFSASITEFWRRWHISLSIWLKDYIYIPLGGNRCSKLRNYGNILITFLISGIWHGANWTFIVWGLIHGGYQIVEKVLNAQKCECHNWKKASRILLTFLLINFAWIFFRMPSVNDALIIVKKIFTDIISTPYIPDSNSVVLMITAVLIWLFKEVRDEYFPHKFLLFDNQNIIIRWTTYLFITAIIVMNGVFDASQFIYVSF
ncbi:MBOAT family O-acyltransferase [Alistipes sp.]|uniref:MBOAT family O-acyltransferase n=1 Tax=Alistipes sp. TaxID=1872444 RepID=UPI003AB894A9